MDKPVLDRKVFLDALKFLAIFLVLFYHSDSIFINTNVLSSPQDYRTYVAYFIHSLSSIAVPLFFVINGALLFNKPYHHIKHIHKIIKIIILGFLWSLISSIVISELKHDPLTLLQLIKAVWGLTHGLTAHLWFLKAMVLIYLLFPIIKTVFDSPTHLGVLYYAMGLFFIFSFGDLALNQCLDILRFLLGVNLLEGKQFNFFPNINPFGNYFYAAFYFILGGILANERWKFHSISTLLLSVNFAISWLLLFAYGVLKSNLIGSIFDTVYDGYYSIMTLVMVTSIYLLSQKLEYKNECLRIIIRRVGDNTLGIYLIHKIIHIALIEQLDKHQSNLEQGWLFSNYLYVLILLIVSLLITEFLRKIPFIRASVTI
jgi:surface polysaccharide O-acyltransferase-like enzyme